ncbi:hypothetical protein CMQ_7622 [Grosmannia clavigera kw1407]|uniref:Uncharacterized protein n=1 Tax=Grosmannia clavigera (strain kw1407 / UAMH 11150) TaxID=655863 RepID=F0XQC0_GROCL|nr:uncharacterized protein CMQ_7622 [Grosmannia clavigera kw1407]EFX00620.1 hypothetical protein CMQ_7622 [Grosmannia clavigera kw1407]
MSAPPPPPPHGEAPKTTGGSGLPPGKYDIFVIPEHSAGAGFLYLPSLRPNINSFVAGFASALAVVAVGHTLAPAYRVWSANYQGIGDLGMMMLVVAVGLGAWALGRIQNDKSGSGAGTGFKRGFDGFGQGGGAGAYAAGGNAGYTSGSTPQQGPTP